MNPNLTAEVTDANYHEWTSCEFYGHNFVVDEDTGSTYCTSCMEVLEDS